MGIYEKQSRRNAESMKPYLEEDEVVRAAYLAQTPIPPWAFVLILPYVFVFSQRYRMVAVTDRNIYVMENRGWMSYRFKGVAHKAPLSSARIEHGRWWLAVDRGPKLWAPPFGRIKRGLTEMVAYLETVHRAAAGS